jgi:hypothetical protein
MATRFAKTVTNTCSKTWPHTTEAFVQIYCKLFLNSVTKFGRICQEFVTQ